MSNSQLQLQQFERNRYFYGKLLSVKDFQLEQNYYIEKRSLLNRFVHGRGVIGGLHLSPIDGTGIRLTPGTAIDAGGREIVVAANVDVADIGKLSGYPPAYGGGVLYAAIAYDEIAREPVPPISNATASTDGIELNKIRETFKLALTTQPPASAGDLETVYRRTVTVFENEQFVVHRSVPRAVNPGDVIEVVLTVKTKLAPSGMLTVELIESLPSQFSMLSAWKDNKIPFVLTGLASGVARTQRYYARAGELPTTGVIGAQLLLNSVLYPGTGESELAVVADRSIVRLLAEQYFDKQQQSAAPAEEYVVLAAITVNNKGIITDIDETVRPFIYNNDLLFQLMLQDKERPAPLPTHAATHRSGGPDELNVNNLSGTLADPQKVAVQDEGVALTARSKINFVGAGVTAADDSAGGRTIVTIPGLASHAATHRSGGPDELNVNNLSGVLAEPQKVVVQEEGAPLTARSKINFIGAGVTATDDAANGRINVTVSGAAASHAATHADGGADKLNVNNLSGTLADPQKVVVQDEGVALAARTKINFIGGGVTATDDAANGRIVVNIPGGGGTGEGAQIATGSIVFQAMNPGEIRVSPYISHQLPTNNVGIILSVVHEQSQDGGLPTSLIGGAGRMNQTLPETGLVRMDIADGTKPNTSLLNNIDAIKPISQEPQEPPPFPGPGGSSIPRFNSTVKTGDIAWMEPELPYVMALYPTSQDIGFTVKIQDTRVYSATSQARDWIVRWWAVAGTVNTGTITVPASGGQTSLIGDGTRKDEGGPIVKPPLDIIDPPIIKGPIDIKVNPPIVKEPVDVSNPPIIKRPVDDIPIIKQPIDTTILHVDTAEKALDKPVAGGNKPNDSAIDKLAANTRIEGALTESAADALKNVKRSDAAGETAKKARKTAGKDITPPAES